MKRLTGSLLCLTLVAAGPLAAAEEKPTAPAPTVSKGELDETYALTWSDEFDGDKLDPVKWVYRTDSKHWSVQLPANVSVEGGLLRMKLTKLEKPVEAVNAEPGKDLKNAKPTTFKYGGAGVISKPAFRYGYYECRMKLPKGAGWHNSFWMQNHSGRGDTLVSTAFQEIDVCENDSVKPTHFGANLHQWKPTHKQFGVWHLKTPDLSEDFHVWGCEYTPQKLRFFFDGKEFASTDKHTTFENNDMHIWLTSIATHLGGAKQVDESKLPAEMTVDYVRLFTKKADAAAAPAK
jgi:beta-glucanase (GH16 family)